jgi:hypothetical protein
MKKIICNLLIKWSLLVKVYLVAEYKDERYLSNLDYLPLERTKEDHYSLAYPV